MITPGYVYLLSHSDVLVSALEACDLAIEHVLDSREDMLRHAELQIDVASRELHDYERDFYTE